MIDGIYITTLKPRERFQKENSNTDSVIPKITSTSNISSCDDLLHSLKKCPTLESFRVSNKQLLRNFGQDVSSKKNVRRYEFPDSLVKVTIRQGHDFRKGKRTQVVKTLPSKSVIKVDLLKTILVAKPDYVEFRNFQPNKLYKKIVNLINVSTTPAKFQIDARPNRSKFLIMFVEKNKNIIPPGMQEKLIVYFRPEIYDEPTELLVINVQHGKSVIVKLCGRRDLPILRVVGTSRIFKALPLEFTFSASRSVKTVVDEEIIQSKEQVVPLALKFTKNTWHADIFFQVASVIPSISEITSCDNSVTEETIYSTIFDCGKCFIGEEIVLLIMLKNIGGKGRFFLMSEIDWCLMNVQDVTPTNTIILSSFAVWPVYFALEVQENICLHVSFLPDSYGLHVDKLYITCDNCSVKSMEIIGDGLIYEADILKFDKRLRKRWSTGVNFDGIKTYDIQLEISSPNTKLEYVFSITNTSGLRIYFRWEKRYIPEKETSIDVHIQPDNGYFPPFTNIHFIITAAIACLQLYNEDIPLPAIPKNQQLHIKESRFKRCNSQTTVDVLVAEIWFECRQLKTDLPSECISEIHVNEDSLDFLITGDEYPNLNEYNQELVEEKLHPGFEVVNINAVKSLNYAVTEFIGILRPSRPLFVGIEEMYIINLRNESDQTLNYIWGKPFGSDSRKINIRFHPENGAIPPQSAQTIQIVLLPLEMGRVKSFRTACCMGITHSLILGIECQIESFYVIFYLPSNDEGSEIRVDFRRVEWHVDSLQEIFHDPRGGDFRMAYMLDRLLEERELMNVDLDEGEVTKEKFSGPSSKKFSKNSRDDVFEEEIFQCEGLKSSKIINSSVLPLRNPTLVSSTRKRVIKFINLRLMTVQKKTIAISNETPISSSFCLRIKNYYPKSGLWKMSKNRTIREIYKRAMGGDIDIWSKMKGSTCGLLIFVEPKEATLEPYSSTYIHIYVFSDTWGNYTDELEVNVVGLPQYALEISVYVTESPISFSICERMSPKIPTFRFGTIIVGTGMQHRKVLIRNSSVLPLIINWHKFSMEAPANCTEPPFNVVLDVFTPFTNKLAHKLLEMTKKDRGDKMFGNHLERYESLNALEFLDKFDSISITDSSLSQTSSNKENDYFLNHSFTSSEFDVTGEKRVNYEIRPENTLDETQKKEVKISIIPYYGMMNSDLFTISPEEIYVPPKGKASVIITMLPKYLSGNDVQTIQKVLGFIRIAPIHKYKDHCYWREDGYFFSPTEFRVEAKIVRPQLCYDICRSDRTFEFNSELVLKAPKRLMKVKKTYLFHNKEEAVISVTFEANDPFKIVKIVTCRERLVGQFLRTVEINGRESIEVEVSCIINPIWLEDILEYKQSQIPDNRAVITRGCLLIKHSDKSIQKVELFLKI